MRTSNVVKWILRSILLVSLVVVVMVPSAKLGKVAYGYGNDPVITTVVDAPWRVEPSCTSIPILIVVKDLPSFPLRCAATRSTTEGIC